MANISTDTIQIGFIKASKPGQKIGLTDGWFSGLPEILESNSVLFIQVMGLKTSEFDSTNCERFLTFL